MKLSVSLLTITLAVTAVVSAQDKKAGDAPKASPQKISAEEAPKHFQETMTVTGKVAQVSIREKLVYINLDKKHPETPFTGVIFARATNQFGNLKELEGKAVEITGKVDDFHDKPQIVINSTNQLKVVGGSAPAADAAAKH